MSILDGTVVLDGEVRGNGGRNNNNRNGGNNKQRNNRRNNRDRNDNRSYGSGYYAFSKSSYLPDDVSDEELPYEEETEETTTDNRADAINEFCDNFTDNIQNYRTLQDIIVDQFPDVIGYVKCYYGNKNKPSFIDALNRLIKTMSTTPFANTLGSVLESGLWMEDGTYDNIWSSIAFGLSVALETSFDRMHTDVVRKYATSILPRMWKPEISDVTVQTGVTKDLALDLFIAIPMSNDSEWNGANIDAFYHRFLDKMIIHAEDNMDVLNWEVQGMLYERIFGKGKTALKVVGKYLASDELKDIDSEVGTAVYAEFKKMLYAKLDRYDIREIEYVFTFVAKYVKEHPNCNIIFDSVTASKSENVRKGLLSVMDKDPEAMKYLA